MSLLLFIRRVRNVLLTLALGTTLVASPVNAATFQGEFFASATPFQNINQAVAAIAGQSPTATFVSTAIDYPNGNPNVQASNLTLATFLGSDAASIVGNPNEQITTSVFRFTGLVDLQPGQQSFAIGSDDGFRLSFNNTVVAQQSGPRSFRFTNQLTDVGSGRVPFELIFYENFGRTGVEFFINNTLAEPAAVPVPATAGLMLMSLMSLAIVGFWRRKPKMALAPAL